MIDLSGKVALVTGAASGIGRETARLLASLGATVVATDLDGEAEPVPGVAAMLQQDVASEEDWARVLARVEADHGRLDALLNIAGIMENKPFAEAPVETLRRQHRINVESVYIGMYQALPLLRASRGSIVNVASIYGVVAGASFAAYSATKGAVIALTKAVAHELAGEGVRVNAILPGPIATNLGAKWDVPVGADGQPLSPEEAAGAWTSLIPMGRLGDVTEIAPLAAFLISDQASFITGAEFVADGGYITG